MAEQQRVTSDEKAVLLQLFLRGEQPGLRKYSLTVIYRPRCPFLYACHKGKAGVIVVLGLRFNHPRFNFVIKRAAMSALEVAQGRTQAVEVRQLDSALEQN